jgi:hypothetical protein
MKYKDEFITIGNTHVKQVNKTTAKNIYDKGGRIYLNACNMMLNNPWTTPMLLDKEFAGKFETMVNEYEYYNCCSERGNYANYFVNINSKINKLWITIGG